MHEQFFQMQDAYKIEHQKTPAVDEKYKKATDRYDVSSTSQPFHNKRKFTFKKEVFEERKKAEMLHFPSFRGKKTGASKPQQNNIQ